ncbi:MAG: MFS transporter [Desulfobacteraceae bacterium]|nr:MAG: MFS transporter [Desulfobacteraceae bacterium]
MSATKRKTASVDLAAMGTAEPVLDKHRWVVFGVFASIYFLVYFHRVSTSVIAADLVLSFNASATALGFMSSMYFYAYAFEQPLVGKLSDWLGPRRVVGIWSLVAALGCGLFGASPSIGWASVGRALIGLGVGGVYVPAMKALAQWFRPREFSTMTGLLLSCGNLGAMFATTPLAFMSANWGWRTAFFTIGAVTLLLAMLCLWLVQDREQGSEMETIRPAPLKDSNPASAEIPSMLQIACSLRFLLVAVVFFGVFGSTITFQGLWATPFLVTVLHMDRMTASGLNMIVPIGFLVGAPVSGFLADRLFRNKANLLILHISMLLCTWIFITFIPTFCGIPAMGTVFFVMGGVTGGIASTLWGAVRENTPAAVLGTTTGLLNIFPLLGMAVMQGVTGALLDRSAELQGGYSAAGFQNAFAVCLGATGLCLFLSLWLRHNAQRPS